MDSRHLQSEDNIRPSTSSPRRSADEFRSSARNGSSAHSFGNLVDPRGQPNHPDGECEEKMSTRVFCTRRNFNQFARARSQPADLHIPSNGVETEQSRILNWSSAVPLLSAQRGPAKKKRNKKMRRRPNNGCAAHPKAPPPVPLAPQQDVHHNAIVPFQRKSARDDFVRQILPTKNGIEPLDDAEDGSYRHPEQRAANDGIGAIAATVNSAGSETTRIENGNRGEDGSDWRPPCSRGSKCPDDRCRDVHPKGWKVCASGVHCFQYQCQAVHPPGRIQKCGKATRCKNLYCEYLHPDEWSPPTSNQSASAVLKSMPQREEGQRTAALPIWNSKQEFVRRLRTDKVIVVKAQTGSGKSTQLPQYAADAVEGLVLCTQPRVIATVAIAQRIAHEYDGTSVGHHVGYRTGSQSASGSRIMIVTDGAFIRMAQTDRNLQGVSVLIIDEAHERSLNTDVVAGIAKEVARSRADFRVVIASATIDPRPFQDFFRCEAPKRMPLTVVHESLTPTLLEVPGSPHPVTLETRVTDAGGPEDTGAALAQEVAKTLRDHPEGHCLVFLPGSREVDRAAFHFAKIDEPRWVTLRLYGSLPLEEQNRVLQFDDRRGELRMVAFCTNVAETSLTVPGVRLVVDTGLVKEARYDAQRHATILEQTYVSRSSADQRKGRAGRTAPGHCVRLYGPEKLTRERATPEILRSSLDQVVLQLCALGRHPLTFDLIDRPDEALLRSSIELLQDMDCVTSSLQLTDRGRLYNAMPFEPRMAHFVLLAHEMYGRRALAGEIAAILSAPGSIFYFGGRSGPTLDGMTDCSSDLLHLRSVYRRWLDAGHVFGLGRCVTCSTCYRTVASTNSQRDGGCRPCRVAHANAHSLNNKTLDIVRNNVLQVDDITAQWTVPDPATSEANLPDVEVIGRCLAWAFPEQVGEFLVPGHPDLGVHVLQSNMKGHLSTSSTVFLRRDREIRFVLPMTLTRLPSGRLILDHAHPMELDWLPDEERSEARESSLEVAECYSSKNLSPRYAALCSRRFETLADTDDLSRFVAVRYVASESAIVAYAPRDFQDRAETICEAEVGERLREDLGESVTVECCGATARLTVRAGLEVAGLDLVDPSCRVTFHDPPVHSDDDFLRWMCEISGSAPSDVEWWRYQRGDQRDGATSLPPPSGIAVFRDEAMANRARDRSATVTTEGATRGCAVLIKVTTKSAKEVLDRYEHEPVKVIQKKPLSIQYKIKISNISEDFSDDLLRNFVSKLAPPRFMHFTKVVHGCYRSFIVYDDSDTRDRVLERLQVPVLTGKVTMTMPCPEQEGATRCRRVKTRVVAEDQQFPAEFIVVFRNSAEADDLYDTFRNLEGVVSVKGFGSVKVDHRDKYSLKEHSKAIAKRHGVHHRFLERAKTFKVIFHGGRPSSCRDAAQDLRKVLAPIRYTFRERAQRAMGQELHRSRKLQSWADEFSLHLNPNMADGRLVGFSLHGERYRQGQFMARLMDYYGSFVDRYRLVRLEPSTGGLFRKRGPGNSQLTEWNSEDRRVAFLHSCNAIEVVVSPKAEDRAAQILKDQEAAIRAFLDRCHQPGIVATPCVYCHGDPDSPFEICGHHYCKECLEQVIRPLEDQLPEDVQRERDHRGDRLRCPTCDTAISVKDVTKILPSSALESLCTALARWYVGTTDGSSVVCPTADCLGLLSKDGEYGPCPVCHVACCPRCSVVDDERHLEKSCERYVQLLEGRTVTVRKLEKAVRRFVEQQWELYCRTQHGPLGQVELNPCLARGCEALRLYCEGIRKLNVADLGQCTVFAWHGTKSESALASICDRGFDPSLRRAQMHGPGEYFGISPETSMQYSGTTHRLVVAQLLNISSVVTEIPNFCYVVNNPREHGWAYNLPVAVVSYGRTSFSPIDWILKDERPLPPPFKEPSKKKKPKAAVADTGGADDIASLSVADPEMAFVPCPSSPLTMVPVTGRSTSYGVIHKDPDALWEPPYRWQWTTDGGTMESYPSDVSATIERCYDDHQCHSGPSWCDVVNVVRHVDQRPQTYRIDFVNMTQVNRSTSFVRRVQRRLDVSPNSDAVHWKYYDAPLDLWDTFAEDATTATDVAFKKYVDGTGPSRVTFVRGPFKYEVDFILGFQENLTTCVKRQIKRLENTSSLPSYTGGVSGASSTTSYTGGVSGASSTTSYTGGVSGASSTTSYRGGISGASSTTSYTGGVSGASSTTSYRGGISGASSTTSYRGGISGASSTTSYTGGVSGASSTTSYRGGISGASSTTSYRGGISGASSTTSYTGGVSGASSTTSYTGGVSGASSTTSYRGGISGASSTTSYTGGVSGASSTTSYRGGISGASSTTSYRGGISGASSTTSYTGGVSGASSTTSYRGGISGASSTTSYRGGISGASSTTSYTGGVSGASSTTSYTGGVSGASSTTSYRGGISGASSTTSYTGGVSGASSTTSYRGGISGASSTTSYRGGISGASSTTSYTGGVSGASSTTSYRGGISGASSTTSYRGGISGASSTTSYTGGVSGASSTTSYTGGVSGASSTTSYRGGISGASSTTSYTGGVSGASSTTSYRGGISGASSTTFYRSEISGASSTTSNRGGNNSSQQTNSVKAPPERKCIIL